MTVHEKMRAVFDAANVSGYLNYWKATAAESRPPQTLAVYTVTRESGLCCADDTAYVRRHDVQIDVYSVSDPQSAADALADRMEAMSFYIPSREEINDMVSGEYRYHVRFNVFYID